MRALVVDDNKVSALELSKKLQLIDVEVTVVNSGKEALKIFEKSQKKEYKIIFMDIMLPDKKGVEVSSLIRKMQREDAKSIPIMAVTGMAYDTINRALEVSGMNGVLKKPIDMAVLKDVVASIQ